MIFKQLGNSSLQVSPLAFGGNVFGWTADEATSFQLLDAWLAAGFNFIDTADVYSAWVPGNKGGESERIIGKWLKKSGKRSKVVIASKVGMSMGHHKQGLSHKYIKQALEDSLNRLQTDYIDLYQSHVDDQETPLEETLQAYKELIQAGKVLAIGASNFSAQRLKQALDISAKEDLPRYQSLQPQYNLYDRQDYEQQVETLCQAQGLGVISYYSLASGFLSGKYRSEQDLAHSARGQGVKKYLTSRGMAILQALDTVAAHYNSTPTSVALAWLMARPSVTAPIVSATNLAQLQDLRAATQLHLAQSDIASLDAASAY